MSLAAGRLRQRIDILRPTKVKDGSGYTTTWAPVVLSLPAEVIGMTWKEAVIAKVLQGVQVYRITIRWRSDIQDSDQVKFGDLDLNIRSAVDPEGRRREMVIIADTEAAIKTG